MTVQLAPVTVYTTRICPYCVSAKSLLTKRGIAFKEIDVSGDPAKRSWWVQATRQKTVPQVFIGDTPVGGSDELHELDRRGELMKRVFGEAATG